MRTVITGREAARLLQVHVNTVRNWADRGVITAYPLPSGVRRYDRDEIVALAELANERAVTIKRLTEIEEAMARLRGRRESG